MSQRDESDAGNVSPAANLRGPSAEPPPRWAGVSLGPTLAGALYVLLTASAALALWASRFPGALPMGLEAAAPWVLLLFIGLFGFYRLGLVRARKYPASKAFFQIGAGLLLFTLLLPGAKRRYTAPGDTLQSLLADANPQVRALAAEVARFRPSAERYGPGLARALEDSDATVRFEAHRSLVRLTGTDLGPPEDEAARRRWRERYP